MTHTEFLARAYRAYWAATCTSEHVIEGFCEMYDNDDIIKEMYQKIEGMDEQAIIQYMSVRYAKATPNHRIFDTAIAMLEDLSGLAIGTEQQRVNLAQQLQHTPRY